MDNELLLITTAVVVVVVVFIFIFSRVAKEMLKHGRNSNFV